MAHLNLAGLLVGVVGEGLLDESVLQEVSGALERHARPVLRE